MSSNDGFKERIKKFTDALLGEVEAKEPFLEKGPARLGYDIDKDWKSETRILLYKKFEQLIQAEPKEDASPEIRLHFYIGNIHKINEVLQEISIPYRAGLYDAVRGWAGMVSLSLFFCDKIKELMKTANENLDKPLMRKEELLRKFKSYYIRYYKNYAWRMYGYFWKEEHMAPAYVIVKPEVMPWGGGAPATKQAPMGVDMMAAKVAELEQKIRRLERK